MVSTFSILSNLFSLQCFGVWCTQVSAALAGIASGWIAVLATLRIKFAKAITLGAAIGDAVRKPAMRFLAPPLQQVGRVPA